MQKKRVCPVERAGSLDNRLRRLLQNPRKILQPFITPGMTVLDLGCGPGFFTLDMAIMVGESGKVIACDLQEGMLQKLQNKIHATELEKRIVLQRCETDKIGITETVDFILAFYMVHEIPDQTGLFKELEAILKPGGTILLVEPPFHVSGSAFEQTLDKARQTGLSRELGPRVLFSKSALLRISDLDRHKS
jgi:ubiquinone/menaquinone biosynthesis C-methylase UbiE